MELIEKKVLKQDLMMYGLIVFTDMDLVTKAMKIVNRQPTVDAEPVRHAKNIGTDYDEVDQFVCSECGIELQDWSRVERDDDDGEETYHEYRFRYCPNCGAKMEEDHDTD